MRIAGCIGAFLLALPVHVIADSDGYYCVGPTYLAYEFSFSDSIPGHNLFIIPLSDDQPDIRPVRVQLDDFQVHGMMCGDSTVQVLGWNVLYRVGILGSEARVLEAAELETPGSTPVGFQKQEANLGAYFGDSMRQELRIASSRYSYELRLTFRSPPGAWDSFGTVDLVRLDEGDRVLMSCRIYDGWIRTR
jgi:hypothetical protein